MKKPIIIISIVIFLGAAALAVYSLFSRSANPAPAVSSGTASSSLPSVQVNQSLPVKIVQEKNTGPDYLTIQGVNGSGKVLNFYKQTLDTEEGAIIFADETDYRLSYRPEEGFRVLLWNVNDPESARKAAESRLLSILGSDTAGICRIGVSVWYPFEQAGRPASFCSSVK